MPEFLEQDLRDGQKAVEIAAMGCLVLSIYFRKVNTFNNTGKI